MQVLSCCSQRFQPYPGIRRALMAMSRAPGSTNAGQIGSAAKEDSTGCGRCAEHARRTPCYRSAGRDTAADSGRARPCVDPEQGQCERGAARCLGNRATLRLQFGEETGGAAAVVEGDVLGDLFQIDRSARREEQPTGCPHLAGGWPDLARSRVNTPSASRPGPLLMPSSTRRRSSSVSSASILRRRR